MATNISPYISNEIEDSALELDKKWSNIGKRDVGRVPHTYFDYVFTGQDVKVYLEGMETPRGCIPIIEFAFNIQQQKVPVYGFWSYAFDGVMRGTRIISGVIRIATVSTNYMRDRIAEAATTRSQPKHNLNPIRGLDKDEANIEKYWTRNLDPDIPLNNNKHIFSAHPPFNLVCAFNMQSVSVGENPIQLAEELYSKYQDGPANFLDYNERLTDTGIDGTMEYVLENVELTSMETEFTPAGEVVSENYSFFARDIRTSSTGTSSSHSARNVM